VEAVPKAYGSVTAALAIRGAADAIAFYVKAFGAKELSRMPGPDGKLMHAEVRIGDSIVMLGDESPEMGSPSPQTLNGSPVALMLYVKDVDAVFARAVAAGAKPVMPPADMFWGDRYGQVSDPFGHRWSIATHKADLTPKQMMKGMDAWMASMGGPKG
jgi:PhnB protein